MIIQNVDVAQSLRRHTFDSKVQSSTPPARGRVAAAGKFRIFFFKFSTKFSTVVHEPCVCTCTKFRNTFSATKFSTYPRVPVSQVPTST